MSGRSRNTFTPEFRERIFKLHTDPDNPKSLGQLAKDEKLAKSTIQSIVNTVRREHAKVVKKKPGPKSKLTKGCVTPTFGHGSCQFSPCRWRKRLMILAKKQPF